MRKVSLALGLAGFAMLLGGCYTAPIMPPMGAITSISAPLSAEYSPETTVSTRSGRASTFAVLGLVSVGDCSIEAAARDGGLRQVNHADYSYLNILGIWQRFTVKVYGE